MTLEGNVLVNLLSTSPSCLRSAYQKILYQKQTLKHDLSLFFMRSNPLELKLHTSKNNKDLHSPNKWHFYRNPKIVFLERDNENLQLVNWFFSTSEKLAIWQNVLCSTINSLTKNRSKVFLFSCLDHPTRTFSNEWPLRFNT